MFKPNYYYCVIHKNFGAVEPIKCIINTVSYKKERNEWDVRIIKIFELHSDEPFREDLVVHWFENWCTILEEFDHKPTDAEMLVYAL